MLKKIVAYAVVLFIVFCIVTKPASSMAFTQRAYSDLHAVATSFARYVNSL